MCIRDRGMEFDAVYVMTDGTYDGSMVTRHAHYIACTRALHELYAVSYTHLDVYKRQFQDMWSCFLEFTSHRFF